MGTRNLQCVVLNNEYKVAQYCQWDGYLNGQGRLIVDFLCDEFNKEKFIGETKKLSFLTDEDVDELNKKIKSGEMGFLKHLDRDCGSDIFSIIQSGGVYTKLQNRIDFANDSLFCEYAYVLDIDKERLEIYKGFNKTKLDKSERFYKPNPNDDGYFPVKHLKTFKLSDLTKDIYEEFVNYQNQLDYIEGE